MLMTVLVWTQQAVAQQDAMFTKYMFNTLVFNPAYAGSYEHLSVNLLHRSQWWGIEGAPVTQTLTIHSPVNDRVGLGLSLIHDRIGPTSSSQANFAYAYRFKVGPGKLAISLQAGLLHWRADWNKLSFKDQTPDQTYMDAQPSKWLPNFGAGVYYHTNTWYLGVSSPHLVNHDLRDKDAGQPDDVPVSGLFRHYYAFGGLALPLRGSALVFRPSFLLKNVGLFGDARNARGQVAAPTEADLDLAFLIHQKLWLGVAYRTALEAWTDGSSSADSGDIWGAFHFQNGLRLGLAFDYTLTALRQQAGGSFEVMLGYDMQYRVDRVVTPRYF